ncbi:MAG: tRNA 2-thiouridine(34) synthase MnmA [Desulfosudaceae bacterium]
MVYVLVSGGLDSLVAARLLRPCHDDVVGLHLLTGYNELSAEAVDLLSLRAGIPVETLDCRSSFEAGVIDYFVREYCRGQTPNPCIRCNSIIKFGVGLEYARQRGGDLFATGHYCRIADSPNGFVLRQGRDRYKDQSYFLAFLKGGQLDQVCFPLGDLTKTRVRDLARQDGLEPVIKKESQDICFIPPGSSYGDFIQNRAGQPPRPGRIEDLAGNVIGTHQGLHRFTIGQRRGINCPAEEPYYVAGIDVASNSIRVGTREQLHVRQCLVDQVNWRQLPDKSPASFSVRVRYRQQAAAALVEPLPEEKALITFQQPQFGITPGQGAVFYDHDKVAGAGVITPDIS